MDNFINLNREELEVVAFDALTLLSKMYDEYETAAKIYDNEEEDEVIGIDFYLDDDDEGKILRLLENYLPR